MVGMDPFAMLILLAAGLAVLGCAVVAGLALIAWLVFRAVIRATVTATRAAMR